MECFRLLFDHLACIEHQFLSGIRDSRKAVSLWGMMRGVGGIRKSEHQIWLAKGLGLELLCWGFKGVQGDIPSEEASTLQIGSVALPVGQCTILVTDYSSKMGIKTVPHPIYSSDLDPCDFWLFLKFRGCRYETIEAVTKVVDTITRGFPWGLREVVGTVQVHFDWWRLLPRELGFHVCTINKSARTKKSGNLFNDPRMSVKFGTIPRIRMILLRSWRCKMLIQFDTS